MKKELIESLKSHAGEMIDPMIECYFLKSKLAMTEGWAAHIVDREIEDDYVKINNLRGDYQIFTTERSVLDICVKLGISEVRFQLPV